MKNKLRYIILVLVLSVLGLNNVFAEELAFTLSATADKTEVTKGSEVSVTFNLKSDIVISDCRFSVDLYDEIVGGGNEILNGWYPEVSGNSFSLHNSNLTSTEAYTAGKNVFKLKYTVNGSGNLTIKNISCVSLEKIGVDESGNATEVTGTSSDVTIKFTATESAIQDDTTLSSLTVTNGTMEPSNIEVGRTGDYIITLNSASFGLSMTATNPDYQDDIVVTDQNGKVISDPSKMTFDNSDGQVTMPLTITVNGKTKYSLLVVYEQEGYDNSLASITLNGEKLTLIDGQFTYKYIVGKDVIEVEADAKLKDSENFKFGSATNVPTTITVNDVAHLNIVVEPKSTDIGVETVTYVIELVREGSTTGGNSSGNTGSSGTGSGGNVTSNPATGSISMLLMAFILVASLVGSIVLYQKNLESYK